MLDIVKSGFNGNGAKPTLAEHAAEIRKLDQKPAASSWRDVLPIHPAAELFPLMTPDELRSLGEDILKNGMTSPIVLWEADEKTPAVLLDGRNRLDAIELVIGPPKVDRWTVSADGRLNRGLVSTLAGHVDPYAYVISVNIRRRHLTAEQKRELIAKLIKATPEKSDRQIAKTVKADHKTVGAVRAEQEARGEIPHVATRTDSKGRQQPAKKATAERNRKARERRAGARAQKREDELKAHEVEEAKAAAKAAQLAADLMKANLAQRVLAWLRWQEGDPLLLQDALSDLLNVYNDPTPEASAAAMKAKFAAADDGLDIPACLRRTLSGPLEENRMVHIPPGAAL